MEIQTLVVSESQLSGLTDGQTITFTTSDGTTIPILNRDGTFTISDSSQLSSPSFELSTAPTEHADNPLPTTITLNLSEMLSNNDTELTSHNHQLDENNILASAYGSMTCSEEDGGQNDTEVDIEDQGTNPQRDDSVEIFEIVATSSEVPHSAPTITNENDSCADTNETTEYLVPEDNSDRTVLEGDLDPPPPPPEDDGNTNTVVIDVSNPIQLCQNSLITVNGQRCVLQQNVETGQLIAYPVREPLKQSKRRGRPRRKREPTSETTTTNRKVDIEVAVVEEESTEKGLVVTANEAGEIVKRSARKRKTNSHFKGYEVGKIRIEGSEEEENVSENVIEDEDNVPLKRGKYTMSRLEKRGRAKPRRRYGKKPPEPTPPPPTQAFLIHTVDGETIMIPMSSISSVQNVSQSIGVTSDQEPKTDLVLPLALKPATEQESPPVISIPDNGAVVAPSDTTNLLSDLCDTTTTNETGDDSVIATSKDVESAKETDENGTRLQENREETAAIEEPATNEQLPPPENTDDVVTKAVALAAITNPESIETIFDDGSVVEEAAVVPRDVVSFLIPNKEEPVKIGLRASEDELEKLLCEKCGFQAFFLNQYQEHLNMHKAQKCKCCVFLALREEELVQHYKHSHPKNICEICNYMAEHPYLVRRHKCRHNNVGSTCDTCGKTYRDQYILKMHIRNVHMPADVLFECSICTKKFTRKAHLKRHLRTHEVNKKYKCSHCNYRGCERSDITKHQLIHETPKHSCEVCGRTFRHLKNMQLHVKRHRGQRDYKCGVCDFFGYTFTEIRKHIERKHADTKTIICDKCGQAFKTEQLLADHHLSDQCDTFCLEENLQEQDSLNEMSSQLAVETIGVEQLIDESNQLTSVTDADGITAITLTDESIVTLNALGGFTSPIMVSNEMGEQLTASHILESSDGQVTILDCFLDHEGNNQVAMVTEDGQMIQGVVMDTDDLHHSWKATEQT